MATRSCRVRVGGPLGGYMADFDAALRAEGFREHPRIGQLQRLARLSRWLERHHLADGKLTTALLDTFLPRDGLGKDRTQPAGLLIEFLVEQGLFDEEPADIEWMKHNFRSYFGLNKIFSKHVLC